MAAFSKPQGLSLLPMLFALFVLIQAAVALHPGHSQAHAMRAHLEETKRELAERQVETSWLSGKYLAIQGVNRDSPAARLEIRDLYADKEAWNLYLLGMELFKKKGKTDKVGFYQIAGVHGVPYTKYNGGPLLNIAGYCPHVQVDFASWHRPYLALFESGWHLAVQEAINTFPTSQRAALRATAKDMRMPYWDWAVHPGNGQPVVPLIMRDEYVAVTKASGNVTIRNPLHSYTWGDKLPAEIGTGPHNNIANTLRRPTANGMTSNNEEMNTKFVSIRVSLRDRIYGIFAARPVPNFGSVATSAIGARPASGNSVDSIESIHDSAHTISGGEGGGHMYWLDYSSFDPIFWLHHTNIDRLLAMYQTTTKDTHISNGKVPHGMAQWQQGDTKGENSPLKPFTKNAKGDWFTSADAKWTRPFGYYYPETKTNKAADVYKAVTALYGPNASTHKKRDESAVTEEKYQGRPFKAGEENYILNIIANKHAVEGSYTVHCLISSPSKNNTTATYPTKNSTASAAPYPTSTGSPSPYSNSTAPCDITEHPDYAGSYAILGGMHGGGEELITQGSLPINTFLQGKHACGDLESLERCHVEPYLTEHLYYKVIGPGGVEIPAEDLNLHIGVRSSPVIPAENEDEMPSFGNYVDLPECTKNKPAGQPYTHVLKDIEKQTPGSGGPDEDYNPFENEPILAEPLYPTESEETCVLHETVKYVDPAGNYLYEETS